MKTQNFISRFLFLTVLFASLFGSAVYAKPLSTDEKTKRKKEVITMLSGTTWDLELFPMDDPKKKTIKDVVSFENGRLKSKVFDLEGYAESNLTVTIEDDGKAIWETMQSHSSKGPIFWRGELADKTVNGVLSRQSKDGSTEAYSLRGIQSGTFVVKPVKAPVIIEAPKDLPPAAVITATPAVVPAVPVASTPASAAVVTAKTAVPAVAAAGIKPAVAVATAVKPAVATTTPASYVMPAKPADTYVKPAVAAVKTEVAPAVAAVTAKTEVAPAEKKKKAKKSKWSW